MGIPFACAPYVYWKMGAYQNITPVKQDRVGALSDRNSFQGILGVDNNLFTYICVKALGTSSPKNRSMYFTCHSSFSL